MATDTETETPVKKKHRHRESTKIFTEEGVFDPGRIRPKGKPRIIDGKEIFLRYSGGGFKIHFSRVKPLTDPVQWHVTIELDGWTTRAWVCVTPPSLDGAKICAQAAIGGALAAKKDLVAILNRVALFTPATRDEVFAIRRGWTETRQDRFWTFLRENKIIKRVGKSPKVYALTDYGQELLDDLEEGG